MLGEDAKNLIIREAKLQGFSAVGFAKAHLPDKTRLDLEMFLESNMHGEMQWMKEKSEIRANPQNLWPQAQSIIVLGMNYGPEENPLKRLDDANLGNISVYAQGKDYHDVMKGRQKQLAAQIVKKLGGDAKVFVDTAPIMEKPLAASTQLGWQGKHTCVVSRQFGSWLFLGEIFTTLKIAPDEPHQPSCGTCSACIEICPTSAIIAPHQLDARRCISYLTIEHKSMIPREFRRAIGNRVYGCDDCLAICPWNKFAQTASELKLRPKPELANPELGELVTLTDQTFRTLFAGTPLKRIGRDRFIRNVLIAIGNSNNKAYLPSVIKLLSDDSELVRAAAVWALSQLAQIAQIAQIAESTDSAEFAIQKSRHILNENALIVLEEWNNA